MAGLAVAWGVCTDEATRNVFYYNEGTGKGQWEPPGASSAVECRGAVSSAGAPQQSQAAKGLSAHWRKLRGVVKAAGAFSSFRHQRFDGQEAWIVHLDINDEEGAAASTDPCVCGESARSRLNRQ